jgi:hypothetical protein
MMRRYVVSAAVLVFLAALVSSAQILKLSAIQGSASFFSFSHCVLPLISLLFGLNGSIVLVAIMGFLKYAGFLTCTYFGLPTFAASLCWVTNSRLVRLGIPMLCMALFIAHPVGFAAMPYTFYWFIPMICVFFSERNKFLTALSSTFVAHAVGSVMHLYFVNSMTSAEWLSLIPRVAIERLVFALGMYVVYGVIAWALYVIYFVLRKRILHCSATTD